jgi:serine/threonine-protein kinase
MPSGAILFELLSARPVFDAEHFLEVMVMQATEPAPRLSNVVADLPAGLDDAVARALARRREERYASMAELASAIMAIGRGAPRPRHVEVVAEDAKTVIAPAPAPAPPASGPPQPVPPVESWPPPIGPAASQPGVSRPPLPSGAHIVPDRTRPGAAVVLLLALIVSAAIAVAVYALQSPDAEDPAHAAIPAPAPPPAASPSREPSPPVADAPQIGSPRATASDGSPSDEGRAHRGRTARAACRPSR